MHNIFFSSRHKVAFCCGRWRALNSINSLCNYIYIYMYADKETPIKMGDFYALVLERRKHVLEAGAIFFSEYWCDFEKTTNFNRTDSSQVLHSDLV